jgi:hypothetical protein
MGVMTRQLDDTFVITSDKPPEGAQRRAPNRVPDVYDVWTGSNWSNAREDAIRFASLDEADEYVRANFAKVMS